MTNIRSNLVFFVRLTFGIGLLTMAVAYVDFDALLVAVIRIDIFTFCVALIVSGIGTIILPALVTKRTLSVGNIRLSSWELIKINLAMRFYVLTLPHAITVGMRWHRYNRGQGKGWEIATLLLFERIVQLIAVVSFAFIFLSISSPKLPSSFQMLIPISVGLCILGLLLFFVFVSKNIFELADPLISFVSASLPSVLKQRIARLRIAIIDYQRLGSRGTGFIVCCTFGWYFCLVLSGYAVSNGLDTGLYFADVGWMRSTIFLLTLLPITVGGIGVREAGFALLFELHGIGYSAGLAFGLILLAIQLLLGLLGLLIETYRIIAKFWRTSRVKD